MSFQPEAPGDWGVMREIPDVRAITETLLTADGCPHFVRGWVNEHATRVLLILHGLGGHSGWYIDLGNVLAEQGITVYAMDHRGFGRSGGMAGHIDRYRTYIDDVVFMLAEIRKRHPEAAIYLLGHSMGGLFATYVAARHGEDLAGVILLNSWIQDTAKVPSLVVLQILVGGLLGSRRYWTVGDGAKSMTINPEAIRMLEADVYWGKRQTAVMLVQVLQMRLAALARARQVTIPALVLQAEDDAAVSIETNRKLYEHLASHDKTWKDYPGYHHDSQFEHDRSRLDADLIAWLREHGE
ncbi:lysophospholipase [Ktedonobacter sp. SOSP1-85]|uniref:alpha/beta hydrolase n=1 Tax=Ktedonobacter sp. SOSP1-85 TaxID=2778367 RepID=UPI0019154741|nr:alpha/beta hydrolase [Ktedonobacter sp. SOSP1-85]GHO81427.1 lysophospholipase [Ktedonobacter sp. SOSP1-85]